MSDCRDGQHRLQSLHAGKPSPVSAVGDAFLCLVMFLSRCCEPATSDYSMKYLHAIRVGCQGGGSGEAVRKMEKLCTSYLQRPFLDLVVCVYFECYLEQVRFRALLNIISMVFYKQQRLISGGALNPSPRKLEKMGKSSVMFQSSMANRGFSSNPQASHAIPLGHVEGRARQTS